MKKVITWALTATILGTSACGPRTQVVAPAPPAQTQNVAGQYHEPLPPTAVTGPVVRASGPILISEKTRNIAPDVSATDKTSLTDGNGAFAFDLYRQLRATNDNLFYSPYSISAALAMTYAGAGTTTADQMARTLHFDLPEYRVHAGFNWLGKQLDSRSSQQSSSGSFTLNVANAIWGQKDYEFRTAFLDTLAENYGAGLRIVDYINEPQKSVDTINTWVSDQTAGLIRNLIGSVTPNTRLILTNAVYFNAAWAYEFPVLPNFRQPFYSLNGSSTAVSMMSQSHSFYYTEGDDYQAVELPYAGNQTSMVILLPRSGKLPDFEDKLDYKKAKQIIESLKIYDRVNLTMPKFEFDSNFSLSRVLSSLGMSDAFTSNADFSGMTGNKGLFIDNVVHKAFISVNETRTVAAAATGVIMVGSPPPTSQPVTVTVDRPFIFLIRDIPTGTILFMGRIVNTNPLKS